MCVWCGVVVVERAGLNNGAIPVLDPPPLLRGSAHPVSVLELTKMK